MHELCSVAAQDALDWSDLGSMRCVCQAWQQALNQDELDESKCTAAIVAVRRERQRFYALPIACRGVGDDFGLPPCDVCCKEPAFPDGVLIGSPLPQRGYSAPRTCTTCAETALLLDAVALVWPSGAVYAHVGRDAQVDDYEMSCDFFLGTVPVTLADLQRAGLRVGAAARRNSMAAAVVAAQPWAVRARRNYPDLICEDRTLQVLRCTL